MSLLKKIFGKKETNEITTTLELLPTLIQKNFEAEIKDIELDSARIMSEIKYSYEKAKKLLTNIQGKELIGKENERFNKAAITSKKQVENQLAKALEKINPSQVNNNIDEIRAYSNNSYFVLISEINSFRKNIVYTSIYLKDEMKELGQNIQGIIDKLDQLNKLFSEKKDLFEFEKIKKRIQIINENNIEIKKIDEEIILKKKEIIKIDELINLNEQEIKKIENSPDAKNLIELEEEKSKIAQKKQQLKTEVSSMLSTIEKPLQRFNALVKNKRWIISNEKAELLDNFITNPLLALKKDVNGKIFKEILGEIKKAIEEEKIELKEKEKEKRINALQELISFDFFENVFWELNKLQKRQNEIDIIIRNNLINKKLSEINENKKELLREKESISEMINVNENKKEKILVSIEQEKEKITQFSEKTLGKKIIIE